MTTASYGACKLCHSTRLKTLYAPSVSGAPVYKCKSCGLRFVSSVFTNEEQAAFYGAREEYRAFAEAERAVPARQQQYRQWLDAICVVASPATIERRMGRRPRLLDIGCGIGDFLVAARERGFDVFGIEPSTAAIELAKAWNNLDVVLGGIEDDPRGGYFDVVTSTGVLEHVIHPAAMLRDTYRVLAQDGVAFIYTPVWGQYDRLFATIARWTGGRVSGPIDRRINRFHLQIFQAKTLTQFLQQVGFTIRTCERLCEYNLPIGEYVAHIGVRSRRLQEIIHSAAESLIRHRLFFRNNMRVLAVKRGQEPTSGRTGDTPSQG